MPHSLGISVKLAVSVACQEPGLSAFRLQALVEMRDRLNIPVYLLGNRLWSAVFEFADRDESQLVFRCPS